MEKIPTVIEVKKSSWIINHYQSLTYGLIQRFSTSSKKPFQILDKNKLQLLAIALLIFVGLFYQTIFEPGVSGGGDFYNYQLTFLEFLKSSLSKSQSILWNPYIGGGVAMTIFAPIFYPFNFLYLFTSLQFYMVLFYLGHFLLAFFGTYLLARSYERSRSASVVAAMVYSLSGFFAIRVYMGHTDLVAAASLIPWQFFLINCYFKTKIPKFLLFLTLPLSLQIFTGNLQICYYSVIGYSLYFFTHLLLGKKTNFRFKLKSLLWFAMANSLGLGLSSFSWLPSQASAFFTTRGYPLPFEEASSFSQPLGKSLLMVFPTPFVKVLIYEGINFFGLIPLLLTVIGVVVYRKRWVVWFFVALVVLTLLVSSANQTPLFTLLYKLLPGFSNMRAHTRSLILLLLGIAVLSAYGFDPVLEKLAHWRSKAKLSTRLMSTFVLCGIILTLPSLLQLIHLQSFPLFLSRYYLLVYLLSSGILLILLTLYLAKRITRLFLLVTFGIVLGFSFYKFDWPYLKPNAFTYPVKADQEIAQFIKKIDKGQNYRVWHDINIESNDSLPRIFNFAQFGVPEAQVLGRNWQSNSFMQMKEQKLLSPKDFITSSSNLVFNKTNLKLFGIKYVVSIKKDLEDTDLKLLKSFVVEKDYGSTKFTVYLYFFSNPNPLFYFQDSKEEFSKYIAEENQAHIKVLSYEQNKAKVQISSVPKVSGEQYLVFNDLNFPGWQALVNGRTVPIETINFGVKGVKVSKEVAEVEFNFKPPLWDLSLFLSSFSFLVILGLISISYLKKPTKSTATLSKSNLAA